MQDPGAPKHAQTRVLASEDVLEQATWRRDVPAATASERSSAPAGSSASTARRATMPTALSAESWPSTPARVGRAVGVPVLAGLAAFVLAVATAITLTLMDGRPSAVAADELAANDSAAHARAGDGGAASAGGHPDADAAAGSAAGAATDSSSTTGSHPAGASADGVPGQASTLVVHVVGEVAEPGIVELTPGARVQDVIAAAGGATEGASLTALNLARQVSDGERIEVPDAELAAEWTSGEAASPGAGASIGGTPGGAGRAETGTRIAVNRASATELEALNGIGPALAQRIIEWRDDNGGFSAIDDLLQVPGIGAKKLDGLRDQVVVP